VLSLCRELLHAGCNPGQAIEISRAGVLALCVPSIARAARLAIEDSEHGRLQFQLARQNEKTAAVLAVEIAASAAQSKNSERFLPPAKMVHAIRRE
jgi:hypothetical protein